MKRNHFFCFYVVALAVSIPVCTTIKLMAQSKISLNERIAKSDLIVIGQVQKIECGWDENKGMIWTYVTISIEESLKGATQNSSIIIRIPGGVIEKDHVGGFMEGMPKFVLNEKALVMLKSSAVKPYYHVVDTPYGKYTISPSGNTVGSTKKIQKLIEEIKSIIASGK